MSFARPLILVLEGDPKWAALCSELLKDEYDVWTAATLPDAAAKAGSIRPYLLLCDVSLPGGPAPELLKRLQAVPSLANVPVVVTGSDAKQIDQPAFQSSPAFGGSLLKPCGQRQLLDAVRAAGAQVRGAPPLAKTGPKKTILVVDDEGSFVQLLDLILHQWNCVYYKARNGEEALRMARANFPDFIITDFMMPEMTGVDFLYRLKKEPHPALRNIPSILITSLKIPPPQVELLLKDLPNLKFVLHKPITIDSLKAALNAIL